MIYAVTFGVYAAAAASPSTYASAIFRTVLSWISANVSVIFSDSALLTPVSWDGLSFSVFNFSPPKFFSFLLIMRSLYVDEINLSTTFC